MTFYFLFLAYCYIPGGGAQGTMCDIRNLNQVRGMQDKCLYPSTISPEPKSAFLKATALHTFSKIDIGKALHFSMLNSLQ